MVHHCPHHIPRASIDPIDSARDALALVAVTDEPHESAIVALPLDHERRGRMIVVMHDPPDADAIFALIDIVIAKMATDMPDLAALILASCRPRGLHVEPDDPARWIAARNRCESVGIELVEWFVISDWATCPRELVGDAPRWRRG